MEEEQDLLICAPIEGTPPVYGSIRAACTNCQTAIWVSISGQKAIGKNSNLRPFCIACAFKRMENETDVKPQIVPGAIDELRRHFSKVQEN